MTAEPVGVAIIGCGYIGKKHASAIGQLSALRLVAVVDEIAASATSLADEVESEGRSRPTEYMTVADMLADAAVDLVVITTPTGMHIEQGLAAMAADKHVLMEKPLGADLARVPEIEAAAAAAAERGLIVSVVSQRRFDRACLVVAQAIAAGRLGRLTSATATMSFWRSQGYYDSGQWRGTWEMDGGGALMNQGIHTVDLLLWFMGRPVEIYAQTALLAHERVEIEDTQVATITFESGALGVLHATTAAYPGLTSRLQILGSLGSATLENDLLVYFHTKNDGEDVGPMGLVKGAGNRADEALAALDVPINPEIKDYGVGHVRQYDDLLRALREKGQPGVTVADGALALATVRAVYVSATLGEPVLFDDVASGKYADLEVRNGPAIRTR